MYTHDSIPTTPKEATMQEPVKQPPEWTQVLSMFDALFSVALKYAEPQIKRMVDEQVQARVASLEGRLHDLTTASDERIKEIADEVARDVMSEHVGDYDHDEYDRLFDSIGDRIDEAFDDYDMDDKIREAIGGLTFSLRVA